MSEKIFQSKKEVLEYLGKNPKDTRLLDRMKKRGEIEVVEDWYRLVQNKEVVDLEERIKEQEKEIEDQEKRIEELEEENRKLRERSNKEPIQEKMESGKLNMDKLREIAAGKFLSENVEKKEERGQFVKGGDKREWNWNIMEYTWKIVLKKKVFKYTHENNHWYWVEDLCRYDKWRLVKLEHNDGEVYEDGVIDIDPEELKFYFEN